MIDKKSILKMVRDVTRRSHGATSKRATNPQREWFIGLFVFLVIAVTGSVLNARTHVQFSSIEPKLKNDIQTVGSYKQAKVDEALMIFGERKETFEAFETELNRQPVVVTPVATTSDEVINLKDGIEVEDVEEVEGKSEEIDIISETEE